MTSLQWQSDAIAEPNHHHVPVHHPASSAQAGDPWFPATMGLLGLIVGFLIGF